MAPAGYSGKPLSEKLGLKENMQVILINEPVGFLNLIQPLPESIQLIKRKNVLAEMVICFVRSAEELKLISTLQLHLADRGMIWLCWAKKSSRLFKGVTEDMLRNEALHHGLVDIKVCAMDENYSGLKVVRRRK